MSETSDRPKPRNSNPLDPASPASAEMAAHPRVAPNAELTHAADQSWCPGCSAPLLGRSCKLRCLRCGYFEDCSNLI